MNVLPTLSADELQTVCGVIDVTVDEAQKGKKRDLLKLVMKHLCTVTTEDDKMTDFLSVYSHLEKEHNKKIDEEAEEKKIEEEVLMKKKRDEEMMLRKKMEDADAARKKVIVESSEHKVKNEPVSERVNKGAYAVLGKKSEIETVKIKDFKINGTIGNRGCANCITYSSLIYQVDNGRKMNFSDDEIAAGIIKNLQ